MRLRARAAAFLAAPALLAGLAAPARGADEATVPAGEAPNREARVFVQLVNADARTVIRVVLDGRVILDGPPQRSPLPNIPSVPATAGPFVFAPGSRHALTADVAGGTTRARFEGTTPPDGSVWIVIRHYPGRGGAQAVPPFFTFALRSGPDKLR